ncbi:MAG: chemotaxis protein CheW [Kiritimatiellia bacterium]
MEQDQTNQCWMTIGIRGSRTCPELARHIHCRNCPRYEAAGRGLLDRALPEDYLGDLTRMVARQETQESGAHKAAMVFRLGAEWLALPAAAFLEINRPRPIRRVPHRSNAIFLGLVSIRGDIQLCFSAAGLLGIEDAGSNAAQPQAHLRRFCVTGMNGRKWVFPADEVCGLCDYEDAAIQPVPVTVARAMQTYTSGIITIGSRQAGIINEELFFGAFDRSLT